MEIEFGKDTLWNCLRIFSKRCKWNLAKTKIGNVLKYFRREGIRIWPRHNLEISWNIFVEMEIEFGEDINWNCPRIISMRCN